MVILYGCAYAWRLATKNGGLWHGQCTSDLARNGHAEVFHGRNMDIGLIVENITAQVQRTRSSVTDVLYAYMFMLVTHVTGGVFVC